MDGNALYTAEKKALGPQGIAICVCLSGFSTFFVYFAAWKPSMGPSSPLQRHRSFLGGASLSRLFPRLDGTLTATSSLPVGGSLLLQMRV